MPDHIDTLTPHTRNATPRRKGQRLTAQERKIAQDKFIAALGNTANVRAACQQAGISRSVVYQWKEHDVEFSIRFTEANQNASDLLYAEAWRRATVGEEEYVISMGKLVYGEDDKPMKRKVKSDRMLELLLKARLPEFRDKQVEQTITIDVNGARDAILSKFETHEKANEPKN